MLASQTLAFHFMDYVSCLRDRPHLPDIITWAHVRTFPLLKASQSTSENRRKKAEFPIIYFRHAFTMLLRRHPYFAENR